MNVLMILLLILGIPLLIVLEHGTCSECGRHVYQHTEKCPVKGLKS